MEDFKFKVPRLRREHEEVLTLCKNLNFNDSGRRPTPVANARGIVLSGSQYHINKRCSQFVKTSGYSYISRCKLLGAGPALGLGLGLGLWPRTLVEDSGWRLWPRTMAEDSGRGFWPRTLAEDSGRGLLQPQGLKVESAVSALRLRGVPQGGLRRVDGLAPLGSKN